jgi:anaerobic magnesium-protoporphyrin IX monomethyl ester cyclase
MYYTRPKYLMENLPRMFFSKTPTPVQTTAAAC